MKMNLVLPACMTFLFLVACQQEAAAPLTQEVPAVQMVQEEIMPAPVREQAIPSVSITRLPSTVREDEKILVRWEVQSAEQSTAAHIAVHYSSISHPGVLGTGVTPADSGYDSLTKEFASGEFPVPDEFTASFTVPEGAGQVYLRAHAIIDGKNYWSGERNIAIVKVGCAHNTPPCDNGYDCVGNECILKSGCDYNNPACEEGYRCENNECARISRGGGGGY